MTTPPEIEKFVQDKAKEIIESGQEHQPIVFILSATREISIIGIDLSEESKEYFIPVLQRILRERNAVSYVFVYEAYMSHTIPPKGKRVRDLPPDDREDVLMITSCENEKKVSTYQAIIRNTPRGRKLESWSDPYIGAQGRMVVEKW